VTFTDDDLKRLKEMTPKNDRVRIEFITLGGWYKFDLAALLARLEAAEAYISSMPEDVTDENCRLHKEWRKAAGKL